MSEFPDKDAMPHPEQMFKTKKEADGKGLDASKRSPESMPEPAPVSPPTDAELDQCTSLYNFDSTTMLDGDWMGQVAEDFDGFNAISSNQDLNGFPVMINEQYPIATSSASVNEPNSEQNIADTPPIGIPSLENFESIQDQQDDFLDTLIETIPEEINLWYADAATTQANPDGLSDYNVGESIPEFTLQHQAILDSFGPAIADEISAKYPAKNELNMAGSQSSQAPTARNTMLQGSERLDDTKDTNSLEGQTSSRAQSKDNVTTQDQLVVLVKSSEEESPASILNFNQYEETFLAAQNIPSSPMNHNENTASNHQGSTSKSSTKIQESAPLINVQHPGFCHSLAGAAQNRFDQSQLSIQEELGERDWTQAALPHLYPDTPCEDFNELKAPHTYPDLRAFSDNITRTGGGMQQSNNATGTENTFSNTSNVLHQSNGNKQRARGSQDPRKRAGWETRPDAVRPRVRMTEEEFQWLRPNEGPRDVFETQRKKAAEERLKEEAEADALEKAGMPRPRPKQQKPFKGGIHIEVWEKDRLNNRRLAQGKSGRELFSEKPKLRGKRKGREVSDAEPQLELKKTKREESRPLDIYAATSWQNLGTINGRYANLTSRNGEVTQNNYANTMPATDGMNPVMINNAYIGSMSISNGTYPPEAQNRRREEFSAQSFQHQYNQNQNMGWCYSPPREMSGNGPCKSSMPLPPYTGLAEETMNYQPRPLRSSIAPMYSATSQRPHANFNLSFSPIASGSGMSPYSTILNEQVPEYTPYTYSANPLRRIQQITDSLIDPSLQSQGQFSTPEERGGKQRGNTGWKSNPKGVAAEKYCYGV